MRTADLVRELSLALRERVLPLLGSHAGRVHSSEGEGGDVTFAIDEEAESFLEEFLAEHAPEVAFYSEDRGLVAPAGGGASEVLVVDPIDGTRPAMAGLESCCVSVAAAPLREGVTMGEVSVGCVVEIRPARCSSPSAAAAWSRGRRSFCRPTSGSTACSGPTASAAAPRAPSPRCWRS
ncbi:MAG TPA: inositol monophosphatase family protein [Thermoleophilaceae bacterium]